MHRDNMAQLRGQILETLGPKGIVQDQGQLEGMTNPWRDKWTSEPALVVQPATTSEVQAVVRMCRELGFPIVPQGGNTGVTGAALCREGGTEVLLSLRRMNRIRELDVDDDMLIAEAGCVLNDVKDAAAKAGRLFPLSLGAQGSCMIGGNIATNAGGINALRYGPMRNMVAGLEVVTANGDVWSSLKLLRKDNSGYDLKQLFIGSEGTLGVITAATLKLSMLPARSATAIVAVKSPAEAIFWFRKVKEAFGGQLTACELIERICIDVTVRRIPGIVDPLPTKYPWYVLLEVDSLDSDADLEGRLGSLFEEAYDAGVVLDGAIASSGAQAQALWHLRESIGEAHRHEGVSFKHDISVPVSKVPAFIAEAQLRLAELYPGIRSFAFGHIGDGNIHFNPVQADGEPAEAWAGRLADINRVTHDITVKLGGSITAEHGVGQLRRSELVHYKNPLEIQMMQSIKNVLDPTGLFNPGKLLP
ncbi:FAD-binding oxidoreductase [Bosea thiooxidans]